MLYATERILETCTALCGCAALAVCIVYVTQSGAQSRGERDELAAKLVRRELQRLPSSIPGRELVQVVTEIPIGIESGWHIHPGEEVGYIIAGQVEMKVHRRDKVVLRAGDGFLIPPRTPHNARDLGPETGRMLSTYLVETGQSLSTFVDPQKVVEVDVIDGTSDVIHQPREIETLLKGIDRYHRAIEIAPHF